MDVYFIRPLLTQQTIIIRVPKLSTTEYKENQNLS